MMTTALALVLVLAVLVWTATRSTRRTTTGMRPPSDAERLAEWERRRGEWRAAERLRQHRVQTAFDARASVHPVTRPRLP